MKKNIFITAVLGLSILCATLASTEVNSAFANTGMKDNANEILCDDYGSSMCPILMQNEYEIGETIEISFVTTDFKEIQNVTYSYEGFELLSEPILISDTLIACKIIFTGESKQAKLTVNATNKDNETLSASVYGIAVDKGIILDVNSFDSAKETYLYSLFQKGIYSYEEYNDAVINEFQDSCHIITSCKNKMTFNNTSNVYGTFQWIDDNNKYHPLQYTKIEIINAVTNKVITTLYTDKKGEYSGAFTASPGDRITIRCLAAGEDSQVLTWDNAEYAIIMSTSIESPKSIEFSLAVDMSSDVGRAFQISQAVIIAARYAKEMNGNNNLDAVKVKYPHKNMAHSGCYYDASEKSLNIKQVEPKTGYPQSYASWDVIMHEYGHHVQVQKNITSSLGGEHSFTQVLADTYKKSNGMRLAWGESYPSVFGAMAQQYYLEDLQDIKTVGDTKYDSYNGSNLNYETTELKRGDSCEATVIGFLWDLYDNSSFESHDNISLDHKKYWEIITTSSAYTLSDFVNYLNSKLSFTENQAVNRILSYYELAAFNLSYDTLSSPTTYTWSFTGISSSLMYDKFSLVFYNYQGVEKFTIEDIDTNTYTLSYNDWQRLYSLTTYYVSVVAYQTDTPYSGGYYSEALYVNDGRYSITIYDIGATRVYRYAPNTGIYLPSFSKVGYDGVLRSLDTGVIYQFGDMYTVKHDESFEIVWTSNDIIIGDIIRLIEYTITDDGYMSNSYDIVYFSRLNANGYSLSQLKSMGYKTITMTITLSVKEDNDGYQHLAIYDGSSSNAIQLAAVEFEHGSGKKDTSYWNHSFTFTFDLNQFSNSYFCIRYNASGVLEDDWKNKYVAISGYISQL